MVAAIEDIDRDLQTLRTAVATLAQELQQAYTAYLKVLGRAMQQQLVLASYHVCTEAYPEDFLSLSFDQRYTLQQTLQKLGGRANAALQDLSSLLHPPEPLGWQDPEVLSTVQENLESAIAETLRQVSREVNELLQTAGVLAKTPIEVVLEVAAKAEAAGRSITTTAPNLLTALINPQENDEDQEPQIIAIYLQSSEIEFLNSPVMAQRQRLRQLTTKLKTLNREFVHKQRQRLVAEAAAAWRACWSTDSGSPTDESVPPA